jgi:DNA repair exonuclease SbcCD ATPase subunit
MVAGLVVWMVMEKHQGEERQRLRRAAADQAAAELQQQSTRVARVAAWLDRVEDWIAADDRTTPYSRVDAAWAEFNKATASCEQAAAQLRAANTALDCLHGQRDYPVGDEQRLSTECERLGPIHEQAEEELDDVAERTRFVRTIRRRLRKAEVVVTEVDRWQRRMEEHEAFWCLDQGKLEELGDAASQTGERLKVVRRALRRTTPRRQD